MSTQEKSSRTWDDVLFENRNKAYGAYQLRVTYHQRVARSFLYTLLAIVGFFLVPVLLNKLFFSTNVPMKPKMDEHLVFSNYILPQVETPVIQQPVTGSITPQVKIPDEHIFQPVVDPPVPVVDPIIPGDPAGTPTVPLVPTGPFAGTGGVDPAITAPPLIAETFSIAAVDVKPDFPGGLFKFYEFIKDHLRFTPGAREAGLNGRYYVTFVVNESGAISNIEMMKMIGYGQDEEVARVLAKSPSWKPGLYQSKPVRTQMVLPINFNLVQ